MLYLITFLSWIAHIISKIWDAASKHKESFNFLTWMFNPVNYLYIFLSLLCVITLILSVDFTAMQNIEIWGITFNISYLIAIVIGWMSPSIIKAILKKFTTKEKPKA